MQSKLEAGKANDVIAFLGDITSAFQNVDRSKVANAFFANNHYKPCHRNFFFTYSQPSNIYLSDGTQRISHNGLTQGEGNASDAFAVYVDPIYTKARDAGGPTMWANAILDNFSMVGTCEVMEKSLESFFASCQEHDLPLNPSISTLLWPDEKRQPPTAVVNLALKYGLKLVIGATEHLGGAIGFDAKKREEICRSRLMGKSEHFFAFIAHKDTPVQVVTNMLRLSGISRASYLAASEPPSISTPTLKIFHEEILSSFSNKVFKRDSADLTQEDRILLEHPTRFGGYGLLPPWPTAPVAYLSSVIRATPSLTIFIEPPPGLSNSESSSSSSTATASNSNSAMSIASDSSSSDSSTSSSPSSNSNHAPQQHTLIFTEAIIARNILFEAIPSAQNLLPSFNNDGTFNLGHIDQAGRAHFQHNLISRLQQQQDHKLLNSNNISNSLKQRLVSARDPIARRQHSIMPKEPSTTIKDYLCRASHHHNFEKHLIRLPPKLCGHCHAAFTPTHGQCCTGTRRKAVDGRHTDILAVIKRRGTEAGITVSIEPRIPGTDRKKPDLDFEFSNHFPDDVMSDLSVIHSTADTYKHIAVESQLYTRALTKSTKYKDYVISANRKFRAFEVTSYCLFGPNARAVVEFMAEHADDMRFTEDAQEFANDTYDELIIAMMKGNARIMRQCHSKSLRPAV